MAAANFLAPVKPVTPSSVAPYAYRTNYVENVVLKSYKVLSK